MTPGGTRAIQDGGSLHPLDPVHVREVLDGVLAREGIPAPPPRPNPLQRVLEMLGELFDFDLGSGAGDLLLRVVLIASALALLVILLRIAWMHRSRRRGAPHEEWSRAAARGARAAELHRRAVEAEGRGELLLALRLELFALVVGLGEAGDLEFRPAWTDRELLARGQPKSAVRTRLEGLLDELDPKLFGHARVDVDDLEHVRRTGAALAAEHAS